MQVDLPVVWLDPLLPPREIEIPELADCRVFRPPPDHDLLTGIERADGAIVSDKFAGTMDTFRRAARLKVVARRGSGFDNIDLAAASSCGICVTATPDAPTISVSEFTIGLILALSRHIARADRQLSNGAWLPNDLVGSDLAGAVVGVLGLGRIGRRVARLLRAFEADVLGHDPYLDAEAQRRLEETGVRIAPTLDDVLGEARIVTIHVPYLPATHHLIGAAQIRRLPAGAFIVNVSRGPVVDEQAVLEGLVSGRLAGAALDVWDPEPPAATNPLLALDSVIATPHLAARTREGMARSRIAAIENVAAVLAGRRPPGLVNPTVWEHRRR